MSTKVKSLVIKGFEAYQPRWAFLLPEDLSDGYTINKEAIEAMLGQEGEG